MGISEFNAGGNPVKDLHPIQGEVEILQQKRSRNQDQVCGNLQMRSLSRENFCM